MINTIETLRKAGFFQSYIGLDNQELLEKLNQDSRNRYLSLLGRDTNYVPDPLTILRILEMDDAKFMSIDLEADVCQENQVYLSVLQRLSKASAGNFQPSDIKEVWATEHGPIHISFSSRGTAISFSAEYMDDWIDERIFKLVNSQMGPSNDNRFWGCSGSDYEWLDQEIKLIRLNTIEKDILEKAFGWSFYKLAFEG